MMTTMRNVTLGIFVGLCATTVYAGGSADVSWHTIDGGGGTSGGGTFVLAGTIAQPDAGVPATGGTWTVTGGFWSGAGDTAAPCPTDIDGNGTVEFGDLLAVLAAWGTCPACPEDINADGVVDFSDLVQVLAAWGACP